LSATSRTVKRLSPSITSLTSFFTTSEVLKDGLRSTCNFYVVTCGWPWFFFILSRKFKWNLYCDVDSALDVTSVKFESEVRFSYVDTKFYNGPLLYLIWKRSFFRWRRFHLQGLKTELRRHLSFSTFI
jgi:hypothetical protein